MYILLKTGYTKYKKIFKLGYHTIMLSRYKYIHVLCHNTHVKLVLYTAYRQVLLSEEYLQMQRKPRPIFQWQNQCPWTKKTGKRTETKLEKTVRWSALKEWASSI